MWWRSFLCLLFLSAWVYADEPDPVPPSTLSAPVKSSKTEEEELEDIHDIRMHYNQRWLILTGLITAAGIAGLVYWLRRKRKMTEVLLVPHEQAFLRLEAARALLKQKEAERYADELSDILKQYLRRRFFVGAEHLTTEELVYHLRNDLASHAVALKIFLERCDEAKFAKEAFPLKEREEMYQIVWDFVNQTRPVQQEVKVES